MDKDVFIIFLLDRGVSLLVIWWIDGQWSVYIDIWDGRVHGVVEVVSWKMMDSLVKVFRFGVSLSGFLFMLVWS